MSANNKSIRGNVSKTKGFSGSYEDLNDKPFQTTSFTDLDSLCGEGGVGIHKIVARTTLGNAQSAEYVVVTFDDSQASTTQYYFYNDGRVQFRTYHPGDGWSSWKSIGGATSYNDLSDKPNLSKVATTGNYEDLFGTPDIKQIYDGENASPISGIGVKKALETIATIEPRGFTVDELSNVADGIYISRFGMADVADKFHWVSSMETWDTYDSVGCRSRYVAIVTANDGGVTVTRRVYRFKFDDNRAPFWEEFGTGLLNENTASKNYVDRAIGDIETSLENIIAKYGLGGDSV